VCKNITDFGFAKGPGLNQSAGQPLSSNNYEYIYQWQQIENGQYSTRNNNGVSMSFGLV
jgi:hypothetical protein